MWRRGSTCCPNGSMNLIHPLVRSPLEYEYVHKFALINQYNTYMHCIGTFSLHELHWLVEKDKITFETIYNHVGEVERIISKVEGVGLSCFRVQTAAHYLKGPIIQWCDFSFGPRVRHIFSSSSLCSPFCCLSQSARSARHPRMFALAPPFVGLDGVVSCAAMHCLGVSPAGCSRDRAHPFH